MILINYRYCNNFYNSSFSPSSQADIKHHNHHNLLIFTVFIHKTNNSIAPINILVSAFHRCKPNLFKCHFLHLYLSIEKSHHKMAVPFHDGPVALIFNFIPVTFHVVHVLFQFQSPDSPNLSLQVSYIHLYLNLVLSIFSVFLPVRPLEQ